MMVGMIVGITVDILIGTSINWVESTTAATVGDWLAFPGKLFLALMQMIITPLLLSSIIREPTATEKDLEQLRKTDLRVVLFFIATTALVIIIGSTVASIIQPYTYIDSQV